LILFSRLLLWRGTPDDQTIRCSNCRCGGSLSQYLTAEELDYLASLVPEPVPPTASFLKVFSIILETYYPLAPQIKEEHPETLEKFKLMGENMEKAQEERRKAGFPNR